MAMMEPTIQAHVDSQSLLDWFIQGVYTSAQWTELIHRALTQEPTDNDDYVGTDKPEED